MCFGNFKARGVGRRDLELDRLADQVDVALGAVPEFFDELVAAYFLAFEADAQRTSSGGVR